MNSSKLCANVGERADYERSFRRGSHARTLQAWFVGASLMARLRRSPIYLTIWSGGLLLGLKGFVAAVLGGLSSFRAAIVGALLLGMLESYVSAYVASGLRDAVAFFILIAVLIFRTQGLVLKPRQGRA